MVTALLFIGRPYRTFSFMLTVFYQLSLFPRVENPAREQVFHRWDCVAILEWLPSSARLLNEEPKRLG